jgi:tRNA (adenine22-N1)-methyltransferase
MQLSKRLQAVADLVTQGNRVADVGCDHAYTSIYLAERGVSPHIIAMDVNQGPLDRAKENIIKYGYADLIDTRKSDGLKKLQVNEADTILIAGMGGGLVIKILSERMEVMNSISEIILQPQSDIHKVRYMLTENNFLITEENMVKEDGKYYVMMKAVPEHLVHEAENYRLTVKEHFYYGRLLLELKLPILTEFLQWDLGLCETILDNLEREQTENSLQRRKEIQERMELIRSALEYFNK